MRVRIGPPTSLATIAVAYAALPPASRVTSSAVGHTALPAACCGLLLALLAALDDVLDAHATPWEAGRGVPVLQVAWVRLRVGVARGSLVLGVADGLFACDFGLLACWGQERGSVCVGIVFIGDLGRKWRGHGEMDTSQAYTLLTLPNVSVWQRTLLEGFEFRLSDEREGGRETMGMTYGTSFAPTCSGSFDAHQGPRFSSNHRRRTRRHRCSHPRERIVGHVCRRPCPCRRPTCSVMLISPRLNES